MSGKGAGFGIREWKTSKTSRGRGLRFMANLMRAGWYVGDCRATHIKRGLNCKKVPAKWRAVSPDQWWRHWSGICFLRDLKLVPEPYCHLKVLESWDATPVGHSTTGGIIMKLGNKGWEEVYRWLRGSLKDVIWRNKRNYFKQLCENSGPCDRAYRVATKSPGEPESYRLICLLYTMGKMKKRVIYNRLLPIIEDDNGLTE